MKKSLLTILGLSANLFLTGCADDQARQQIADTNQRLNQMQQNIVVLDNKLTNQKVLDLLNQIGDLQTQIAAGRPSGGGPDGSQGQHRTYPFHNPQVKHRGGC